MSFKEYDVRGTYPDSVNEELFYKIGKSLAFAKKFKKEKKIAVGKDARLSSDSLQKAFIKGLIDAGKEVINLGRVTSPMVSFYSVNNKIYGAMITASHNPRQYNGIKFVNSNGIQISYSEGLNEIKEIIDKKKEKEIVKKGHAIDKRMLYSYEKYINQKFKGKFKRKLKVVFDCSNGVAGISLIGLPKLDLNYFIINENPNGNFPNHSPDTMKEENLLQLKKEVKKKKADLGIMYDGDADRVSFVDEKGVTVKTDIAFLILALKEIKKNTTFLVDLRSSRIVEEEIKKRGGKVKIMRVGNPFFKKEIRRNKNAILGGELSGHIMYKEHFGIDDPFFASLKMIEIISNSKYRLSEIVKKFQKYHKTGEINYKVKNKESVLKRIESEFKDKKILKIDGISVIEKDVWFNIRASNTEPLLRINIEGKNKKIVEAEKKLLDKIIELENKLRK